MRKFGKKKSKTYKRKSSPKEIYEQETFYELIVEDRAEVIQDEEIIDILYEALKYYDLNKVISEVFKFKKIEIRIMISDQGGSHREAKIVLGKKSFSKGFLNYGI